MWPLLESLALQKEAVNIPSAAISCGKAAKPGESGELGGESSLPHSMHRVWEGPACMLARGLLAGASWIWWRSVPWVATHLMTADV